MYRSVHGVLTLFPPSVSCHQSVISELFERMESVPPEEQKTQGRDVSPWALYPITCEVVMEDTETCLTLSHREQLPLTDERYKDVILGSDVEEATLHFWSLAWLFPMSTQIFSTQSPVLSFRNELFQRLIFPFQNYSQTDDLVCI